MKDIAARLDTMMDVMEQALNRLSLLLEHQQPKWQDNIPISTLVQITIIRDDPDYHDNPQHK